MSGSLPIVLEGVGLQRDGATLLQGIDLRIEAGAPTVLVGPNGAGKTRLLHLLMGLLPPTTGRLRWGEVSDARRARLALVFQRPVMMRRTVEDNLRFALTTAGVPARQQAARVAQLLAQVGLSGLAARPAPRLSGGERQRLALARALARDPQVLLLDEPTASLDPAATAAIESLIHEVAGRGVKVVLSTHDLASAARLAGDLLLLHRGRLVEHGPAASVFGEPRTEAARRFLRGDLLL